MIGAALLLAQAAIASSIYEQPTVPDPVLADLRGGIRLPNGIDAALTIETQTAVNGALVLMTVVKIDTGAPQVEIFAPPEGAGAPAQQGGNAGGTAARNAAMPTISFDGRNGLHVIPGTGQLPVNVSSGGGAGAGPGGPPDGLHAVDATSPVQTDNGQIASATRGNLAAVELTGADLQVLHFTGNAFGSAIANSGSDRAIDTQTTLSLDLSNAGPDVLGSAMLRVEGVAIDAMLARF